MSAATTSGLSTRVHAKAAPNDYADLKRQVREAGLLAGRPWYYLRRTLVVGALLSAAVAAAALAGSWLAALGAAVFLGFVSTQIALLAHDIGHRQGFRGRRTNALARLIVGNVVLGVSHSWWNTKHNKHHATPNHTDADPDIQFPVIVFSTAQLFARPRWLRPVIAYQAIVFPFLLPLQAANLRFTTVTHLRSLPLRRRLAEGIGVAIHVGLYVTLLTTLPSWQMALAFVAVHHAVFGVYNSSVFAPNHKGMPLIDESHRLDFLREQVLTARNVRGSRLLDFWYGGLNFQIEHHLFPTLPCGNLRRAQPIVRAFCAERGIAYYESSILRSYREIAGHLHTVSAPLRRRMA